MSHRAITRRDFLKVASAVPLAGALAPSLARPAAPESKVRVVLVRHEDALGSVRSAPGRGHPGDARRRRPVPDRGSGRRQGLEDAHPARRHGRHQDERLGQAATTAEVEQAIKRRVMDAGVPEDRLSIDDRGVLRNPVFQKATALINARPARTHQWSGMGSCIKNYIMFTPQPSAWHGDTCADLAGIWNLPEVKGKTRLNVLVMLTPLFHMIGTQQYNKDFTWAYQGLIVSRDPVAADATGLRVLEAKRREHFQDDGLLKPTPHHIQLADTRHHLGVSDPARIELVKLGWSEGLLI